MKGCYVFSMYFIFLCLYVIILYFCCQILYVYYRNLNKVLIKVSVLKYKIKMKLKYNISQIYNDIYYNFN